MACGERCDELLTNLFKAYEVIRDDEFLMFIWVHEFNYEQTGSSTITAKTIMNSVENHYEKRLIENTWTPKVARADRECIVALPAYDALVATVHPSRNNNRNNNGPRNAVRAIVNRMMSCTSGKVFHRNPEHH